VRRRVGRLLLALGAFPVRRGESDQDAIETARVILGQGGLVAVFPEGDPIADAEALAAPHRGAARLALELGAPLIPAAITGTARLRRGPILLPRRVQVAFAEPILVTAQTTPTPEAATDLIEDRVWPAVEAEFNRMRSRPGLVAAALAALGIGGAVAVRRRGTAKRRRLAHFRRIGRRRGRSG
jgi:1-acyl-sn-glycerol-3-phosphate acyltransferase